MITFTIPIKTVNSLNGSQGRSRAAMLGKAARRKKERNTARLVTGDAIYHNNLADHFNGVARRFNGPPCTVTLTRLSAGVLDSDAAPAALKSCRDGIADALGINDGSDAVTWKYEQRKVKRGQFGVEVSIG